MFRVTNKGPKKLFRTGLGMMILARNESIELDDIHVADQLAKEKNIKVEAIERSAEVEIPAGYPNFSKYRIHELRSIASRIGIEGIYKMREAELVERIQEVEG